MSYDSLDLVEGILEEFTAYRSGVEEFFSASGMYVWNPVMRADLVRERRATDPLWHHAEKLRVRARYARDAGVRESQKTRARNWYQSLTPEQKRQRLARRSKLTPEQIEARRAYQRAWYAKRKSV